MSSKSPFEYRGHTMNLVNGESVTIPSAWGIRGFSVLNLATSTDNATINGGTALPDGVASENNIIIPGGSRSWSAPNNGWLVGMVITAGASCTVQIQFLL